MTTPIPLLSNTVTLSLDDTGEGPAVLLLHGGAGPASMRPLQTGLERMRCLVPTIPGFDGTPLGAWPRNVADLATLYLALLDRLDLRGVTVVGNSVGGWIAAEMASRRPERLNALFLLNAVGLPPTHETGSIANPLLLSPPERSSLAFHDPARFAPAPTAEMQAQMAANGEVLYRYAGDPYMYDPDLGPRLSRIAVPTCILWGVSDRIVSLDYGLQFGRLIPAAQFEPVEAAGHFPHIERPDAVIEAISTMTTA